MVSCGASEKEEWSAVTMQSKIFHSYIDIPLLLMHEINDFVC